MAPPADHPDHWQRSSTSVQPMRTSSRRTISTEADRYTTRSRNRARSNEGSGGNTTYTTQISSPPAEEVQPQQASQTDYVMASSSNRPQNAIAGHNLFSDPFEIQVRGRLGITSQIRQDLALGRLFGVLTIIPIDVTHHSSEVNGGSGGRTNQHQNHPQAPIQVVAAVSPVPSLDDASDSSPPPPFVAGTLTFSSLRVHQAGRWRISVSLLRMNNGVAPPESLEEGVVSLGSFETDEILVH